MWFTVSTALTTAAASQIRDGPYTEPLVSLEPEFWLRYPRFGSPEVTEGAVPRILTPPELAAFLEDVTEQELRMICEQKGWGL